MSKNMLVADDSVVIQKSIGITFAQEDFSITYVSNGDDAIAKIQQSRPDIVLADVVMPAKNGYEVCQIIRGNPQTAAVPVLLLAGTHEPYDENKARSVGATGYMLKPFESQALIDRVKEIMSEKPAAAPAPAPQAAPQAPPPTTPSPASTIAGQSPYTAPIATPSPSSTIAGQSPLSRETPMLDLDMPEMAPPPAAPAIAPFDTSFDFSFDDSPQIDSTVAPSPQAAPVAPPIADPIPASEPLPSGDIWDFAAEPAMEAAPAASADLAFDISVESAIPPAAPAPLQEFDFAVEPTVPAFETPLPMDLSASPEPDFSAPPSLDFSAPSPEPAEVPPPPMGEAPVALALSDAQIETIVRRVFEKVIERIAWEVVPDMAETIIKEELARLTQDKS